MRNYWLIFFLFFSRPRKNMIQPPDYFDGRRQTCRDIRAFFREYVDNFGKTDYLFFYFISYTYICISNQVIYWKYEQKWQFR